VIILADMNDDMCTDPIQTAVTQIGLAEAVTTQHGPNAPNTHNRGSTPINGIFLTPDLTQNITSGYLAFGEGILSDHQAVWIDIPVEALGWFVPQDMVPLKAWRLKCKDPRIITRYNLALEKELTSQNLPNRMQQLEEKVKSH